MNSCFKIHAERTATPDSDASYNCGFSKGKWRSVSRHDGAAFTLPSMFALPLRLNHFPRKSHSLHRIYVRGSSPFLLGYEKHPNYLGRAFENTCAEVNNKFCIFIKTVINVVFMKNIPIFYVSKLINFIKFEIL